MPDNKKKVLVAMSGGVDSSVTAALLVERGYEVTGIMFRLWSEQGQIAKHDNRCCTRDQMLDAHFVARQLDIPFRVIDTRETFKHLVVDPFIVGYGQGLTPNPCLTCNQHFRFDLLLKEAMQLGINYIATGHYARILPAPDGLWELHKGTDSKKDQSYVLSVLNQSHLGHLIFPVGGYTKQEVRELAHKFNLRCANKEDSQDLCFVADGNYHRFLHEQAPHFFQSGPVKDLSGHVIGSHSGLPDYTIGQRKGLGISSTEPFYVMEKDIENNTLIVGKRNEYVRNHFRTTKNNWISGKLPESQTHVDVKIRYKSSPMKAHISPVDNDTLNVALAESASDVTPGQGAVFYESDRVLGCGIIAPIPI